MEKPEEIKKPDASENHEPQEPKTEDAELTENELDDVAGGLKPLNPQPLPPRW